MEENTIISSVTSESLEENTNNQNISAPMKPYVLKNFEKELKRTKWPIQKKHHNSFIYIFVFIIMLTAFFAIVSLGATELIKAIGAN